jgi:hypothetical protein
MFMLWTVVAAMCFAIGAFGGGARSHASAPADGERAIVEDATGSPLVEAIVVPSVRPVRELAHDVGSAACLAAALVLLVAVALGNVEIASTLGRLRRSRAWLRSRAPPLS